MIMHLTYGHFTMLTGKRLRMKSLMNLFFNIEISDVKNIVIIFISDHNWFINVSDFSLWRLQYDRSITIFTYNMSHPLINHFCWSFSCVSGMTPSKQILWTLPQFTRPWCTTSNVNRQIDIYGQMFTVEW